VALGTPIAADPDGDLPNPTKKSPFDPSNKIKLLNYELNGCLGKTDKLEQKIKSLNKAIKSDEQSVEQSATREADKKARRDNEIAFVKNGRKILKKGVDADGNPLGNEQRAKLENRVILSDNYGDKLQNEYEEARADAKIAKKRLRATKSEHKRARREHGVTLGKYDALKRKIAKAKEV